MILRKAPIPLLCLALASIALTSATRSRFVIASAATRQGDPQIEPGATYRLTNDYAGPGKSLAVSKNGDAYNVVMTETNGLPNQLWKIVSLGGGKFRLINAAFGDGRSLDTPKPGNDYAILLQASGGYTGQFWSLTPVGSGKVRLTNDYAGPSRSLDTPLSGSQHVVVLAATGNYSGQFWTLTKTEAQALAAPAGPQIDPAAIYRLTNDYAGPGKSLAVSGNSGTYNLVMSDTGSSPNQLWKLVSIGNDRFRLVNLGAGDGRSLDTPKSGNNYLIVLQPTGNYSGQSWSLTPVGNGRVRLTNDYGGSSFSLDTPMSGNQYIVVLAASGNYTGQSWSLTKVPVQAAQPPAGPLVLQNPTIVQPAPGVPNSPKPTGGQTTSGSLVVGPVTTIPAKPLTVSGLPAASKGAALCVEAGAINCGTTNADWVGAHTLNLNCEKGIYDPIWGGTCWQPPSDDGRGAWIRSATKVTDDDAYWREPKELLTSAVKVKNTAFAWDCSSGSFWDGYAGGACWKCPDDYPRRTANHIASNTACATPIGQQQSPAIFVAYNGCPKPDAKTMGLQGLRTPARPFLQIGSGCYACPATDEDGNILVTERNVKPIAGDAYANNNGCTIKFKWKPATFVEPGMGGIGGIKDALNETLALDSYLILTNYFRGLAKDKGYQEGSPESIQYIAQMWNDVGANPYKSLGLTTLMYAFLETAVRTDPSQRTAGQTALVKGFSDYVTTRRTFIAQQALDMYDGWKAGNDANRTTVKQSQLMTLFYYGTVPLDFQAAAGTGLVLGGAGLGTAGAVAACIVHAQETLQVANAARTAATAARAGVSAAQAASNVQRAVQTALSAQRVAQILTSVSNFRLLAIGSQVALTAGPLAIAAAGSILISIAMDQFVEIVTARDKLNGALDTAKQPADLSALLKAPDGRDQLAYLWSRAIDGNSPRDPDVEQRAASVQATAKSANYVIPVR